MLQFCGSQDFTPADFDLVGALVTDPKGIVVGGDPAQAIHLGKSAGLPPPMKGHRWSRHHLEGSYRLPVRVCEAVAPIARAIQAMRAASGPGAVTGDVAPLLSASEVVLPHGVKNAVLGVRPVVVAGSHSEVRDQVCEVLSRYGPLLDGSDGERIVTIAEGDEWIEHALRGGLDGGFALRRESMRAIKGLERPCVIWSTRAAIPDRESHDEWIYTILTRTTCLVVLAVSEATPPAVSEVLGRLEPDRLLFWTEPARARFTSVATASLVREED